MDEKRAVATHPSDHPGLYDQHMTVAIGSMRMNKVIAMNQLFPTHVAIVLASRRAYPLTVIRAMRRRGLHCTTLLQTDVLDVLRRHVEN